MLLYSSLETVVVLLVLLAFALEAVVPVAVVAPALAAVADVEARVHLRKRVHAQNFMDLTERQQPQGKLKGNRQRRLQQAEQIYSQKQKQI